MEKIYKHARSGSHGTRARYKSSCRKFIEHLDEKFKMQNLRNLQDKHLVSYIKFRQEEGVAAKTIKSDLGAIRYMHNFVANAKHQLSSNAELQKRFDIKLEKTPAVKGDRAWTEKEYQEMKQLALERKNVDVTDALKLAKTMGLRVAEVMAVSRAQAEKALRTGVYEVRGEAKNGKHRKVPLSKEGQEIFERRMQSVKRGQRLFIRKGEKTHHAINRIEKFIQNNRDLVTTKEGQKQRTWTKHGKTDTNELTMHGLRYNYVQERMSQEMERGFTFEQAASRVTQEVGHERTDVIKVYMGGKSN